MIRLNALARCLIGAAFGVIMAAVPLVAHHSFAAEFDEKKPIQLKGTLTGASLVNPHGWLHLDVSDDAANRRLTPPVTGKTVKWSAETGGVNSLYRRGWRPKDLPIGRVVIVEGYMAKDGSPTINAICVTFEDGKTLDTANTPPQESFKGTGLAGSKVCGGRGAE